MSVVASLGRIAKITVRRPSEAAALLKSLHLSRDAIWTAFWLVCVLAAMLQWTFATVLPASPFETEPVPEPPAPLTLLIDTLMANGLAIFGIWKGGQLWRGEGTAEQSAALMIFLQALGVGILTVFFLLFLVAPILAQLAMLVIAIWALWVNLSFINVLHRFGSLWKALGLSVAVWIGVFLFQIFLFTLFGGLSGV